MFRYAVARVRDTATAEDLVQDTLLAAIGALDSFKGGSTEQTWLIGILRHKVLDYFRVLAREQPIAFDGAALEAFLLNRPAPLYAISTSRLINCD